MARDGFKLDLPNGDTFEATNNIVSRHQTEFNFVFNGGNNILALYEQFAGSERSNDGLKQSAYLGSGAGVHRISIQFDQYEGSSESWGEANADDGMQTKRDVLDRALNVVQIDSGNPAILATGEYDDSSGLYDSLKVVVLNADLEVNYQEQTSVMNGTIEFAEAADIREVNSAEGMTG